VIDLAELTERGVAKSLLLPSDAARWHVYGLVAKYNGPESDARAAAGLPPDDYAESFGNLVTSAGLTRMTSLITAAGGQGLTNTSGRIGVGDSATGANVADTDLGAAAGSTHRQFEVMSATYPQTSLGVITARSLFTAGEANFVWNEWGIDIGTPTVSAGTTVAATLLNHKITALGTKTAASSWTFTVTITIV
jgi:hypothetical protein